MERACWKSARDLDERARFDAKRPTGGSRDLIRTDRELVLPAKVLIMLADSFRPITSHYKRRTCNKRQTLLKIKLSRTPAFFEARVTCSMRTLSC